MTPCWKVLALVCAIFLSGCYDTTTTNPIGTTAALAQDKVLIGIWKGEFWRHDEGEYLHIFPTDDQKMTALWIESPKDKDHGSYQEFQITTAGLGRNRFINAAKRTSDGSFEVHWMPLFYTLRNDGRTLTIYTANDDKVVQVIDSHALRGEVKRHQEKDDKGQSREVIDSIEITAEPAELDAFMARPEAADLFRVFMRYKKIE